MSGTNMIEIRNLCKTYGDLVIFDHLDLTLAPDTVYCLTAVSYTHLSSGRAFRPRA